MEKNELKRPPTVKDVARAAGVTAATVSNVLRGKVSEVSAATAKVVMEKVAELGYVRNLTASALSSKKANAIALIMVSVFDENRPEEDAEPNPFYGELAIRMERAARKAGYALYIYAGPESGYENFLLERNLDAAILCGVTPKDSPRILKQSNIKLILFDAVQDDPVHMTVRGDEREGGRLAVAHLLSLGRKRLAFVGPPLSHDPNNIPALRYYGARDFCRENRIDLKFQEAWTHLSDGIEAGKKLARGNFDGVFASSDVLAAGAIRGLLESGKKVPSDVAVIGYDDLPLCMMTVPPLTTINQKLHHKIHASLDLVIQGKPGDAKIIKPVLVARKSA